MGPDLGQRLNTLTFKVYRIAGYSQKSMHVLIKTIPLNHHLWPTGSVLRLLHTLAFVCGYF